MTSEEYTFFKSMHSSRQTVKRRHKAYEYTECTAVRRLTSLHGLQDTVPGGPNSKSILLYILKSLKQMYLTHQGVLSCASPMRTSSGLPAIQVAFLSNCDHLASLQMGWWSTLPWALQTQCLASLLGPRNLVCPTWSSLLLPLLLDRLPASREVSARPLFGR